MICEQVGVAIKIPANIFSLKLSKSSITKYNGLSVVNIYTGPSIATQFLIKRFIDIVISVAALILFSPLFLVTALLIRMTSKGPAFFIQDRIGYNGRIFKCIKFRTMVENAEEIKRELIQHNEVSGPVFKIKHDPRITPLGRFLRKTSIDELPQLINVIRGEMSLVGPRPPVPGEVNDYGLKDRRRLSMRPGITCLWQVNGRHSIPFEKWVELDKQYIDNWSLWLDLKILVKTIPVVLKCTGA